MLSKEYFNDAFILHDQTFKFTKTNEYLLHFLNSKQKNKRENSTKKEINVNNSSISRDIRNELNEKWASFKNIFKYQPLWMIRNYFGEFVALYFAYCGALISSLWLISIIGTVFFLSGLLLTINNQKSIKETLLTNATAAER